MTTAINYLIVNMSINKLIYRMICTIKLIIFVIIDLARMPPKQKKTNNPIAPVSKSKKEAKQDSKFKLDDKNIDDLINDDVILSDEDPPARKKMKRLKKLRKVSSSEEQEQQRFIDNKKKLNSEDQSWKSQDEQDFKQMSQQGDAPSENEQYSRYALADDDDIKADQQKIKNSKNKKTKNKLKDNQQIDKYLQKSKSKVPVKQMKKQSNTQIQLNIVAMLTNNNKNKSQAKPKRKDSLDDIEIDSNISDCSDYMNKNRRKIDKSISKAEQAQIQQAIRRSKAQMQKQQDFIYRIIQQDNSKQEQKIINHPKHRQQHKQKQEQKIINHSKHRQQHKQQLKKQQHKQQLKKSRPKSAAKKTKKQEDNTEQKGPLSGLQIALTGEFEPYKKGKLAELVVQLGAKNAKSITKKATHLFQGLYIVDTYGRKTVQLPSQTSKSVAAVQKGVPIVLNGQLDDFFIKYTGKTLQQLIEKNKPAFQPKIADKITMMDIDKTGSKTINLNQEYEHGNEKIQMMKQLDFKENKILDHTLWTEKYKPNTLDEIIGQKSQVRQLCQWLEAWEDIHVHGNKRDVKASFNSFLPSGNINSKAALLSGDAGLGKTTTARLASMNYNYGVVQYNASQSRNKKSVIQIGNGKDNHWLASSSSFAKTLIIMDQIDGMSSGDRGGITAIIDMIKNTRVPIICICNDRQSPKIRSLAGHCNDIKFHKPEKSAIIKRLQTILDNEGGKYTHKGLQRIVEMMQNDMRQIITYLQFFFRTVSHQITYDTIQKHPGQAKDNSIMINHFQASKRLMNRLYFDNMSIAQRTQLAFVDSDFVPLMIHENYLNTGFKKKLSLKQFKKVVKATDSFVLGDLVDRKIMRTQNYTAMPNKMFLTCVYPTEMFSQSCGYAKFTSWLGKFSTERKNRRLIKQLKSNLAVQSLVSVRSVKHNYSAMIFQWIVDNLKGQDPKILKILQFMDFYNINPSIINQNIAVLQYGNRSQQLKNISSGSKTKLTKAYNAHHEKLDKKKGKQKKGGQSFDVIGKFDPVLGQIQAQNIEQQEQEQQQASLQHQQQADKKKTGKSKPKKK